MNNDTIDIIVEPIVIEINTSTIGIKGDKGDKGDPYGNIDGGKANSNYGGIPMIFGGNAEDF